MSQHARFAPSGAPVWGHCSGSVQAQAAFPDTETPESREGTAAHWVISEVLSSGTVMAYAADLLGQTAPNGVVIDEKMVEGAQVMIDDVLGVLAACAGAELLIEHRVAMPAIHPENWGTLDAALYVPSAGALFLWDYKHGHRENSAAGNLQLIDYVAGLVQQYRIDGVTEQNTRVVLRIVQPFCYTSTGPVSEWVAPLTDLRGYWNRLHAQAAEADTGGTLTTGLWCRDCKAVGVCAAERQASHNLIAVAGSPYEMDTMSGADLATERRILSDGIAVAGKRLEAIGDQLHHRATSGGDAGGLVLETTSGRREWAVPPAQAVALASQFGVDASKPGVLTPTQTLARAPAAVRPMLDQVMKNATRRPAGKTKLVEAADSTVARAFKRK